MQPAALQRGGQYRHRRRRVPGGRQRRRAPDAPRRGTLYELNLVDPKVRGSNPRWGYFEGSIA
jgi:hypothetical protein